MTPAVEGMEDASVVTVPLDVAEMIEQHREQGCIEDHDVRWRRQWWDRADLRILRDAIDQVTALSKPADGGWLRLSRRAVLSLAPHDGGDPWPLFTGTMIWGYGDRGYGADRTARILRSTKQERVRANLLGLVAASRRGHGEAWHALTSTHRTYLFGPAFATKLAYFAAYSRAPVGARRPRPLVADANTSRAMWHLCRIPRSAYTGSGYLRYVNLAHEWAVSNDWRADEVERALFDIGKNVGRRR